jgi:hypothetical protein
MASIEYDGLIYDAATLVRVAKRETVAAQGYLDAVEKNPAGAMQHGWHRRAMSAAVAAVRNAVIRQGAAPTKTSVAAEIAAKAALGRVIDWAYAAGRQDVLDRALENHYTEAYAKVRLRSLELEKLSADPEAEAAIIDATETNPETVVVPTPVRVVTARKGTRRLLVVAERREYVYVTAEDGEPIYVDGIGYTEIGLHASEVTDADAAAPPAHYGYNDILRAASNDPLEGGGTKLVLHLREGDTADSGSSTKWVLAGPGTVTYYIRPDGWNVQTSDGISTRAAASGK